MPTNTATRRGHYSESRIEVMNVQEKLRRDLDPAVKKLEALRNAATGAEKDRIQHTYEAMLKAMAGIDSGGRHKVSVEGYNGRAGYDQYEGVPVDEAIKILKAAEAALPANSPEKPGYASVIARLEQNSVDYFKEHYGKPSNADVVGGRAPLSADESDRHDMRVRHEAKLISKDYRASRNPDDAQRLPEDYEHGRLDLNERREWKYSPVELPKVVGLVEASHSAETLAKMRSDAEITRLMNHDNRLKRFWYKATEEGKRQSLYRAELRKISGQGKKYGWFVRTILRRKDEADDKQNLFRGTGKEAEHFSETSALAKRFADGYIRQSEGEQRSQLTDPAFNDRINNLVHEYAVGNMSDAEFEDRKDALVVDIKKKYPGSFKKGILTADNFLEAARTFRKFVEHGGRLARTDVNLQVMLGEARSRIKSEANLNWTERFIRGVEKNALGRYLKPAVIGYASSVAGFLLKRPLAGLLGAAGLGGAFGVFRRSKQVKQDIAMHRAEREAGISVNVDPATAKRRAKAEEFVMEMRKSSEILQTINQLRGAYKASPTPENRAALLEVLADTEARMSLSAQTKRGLIEFDGETSLERSAMNMMATLAECKLQLGVADITTSAKYKEAIKDLRKEVEGKDKKAERYRRWEMLKAGLVGTAVGFVAGAVAEEATDELGEILASNFGHSKLWDWMDRPAHGTSFERLGNFVRNFGHRQPGTHWWDWFRPDYKGCSDGTIFGPTREDLKLFPGHSLKIDNTLKLLADPCQSGLFHAVDSSGQNLQDFSFVNNQLVPSGKLNPDIEFKSIDVTHASSLASGGRGVSAVNLMDSIKSNLPQGGGMNQAHNVGWYDQDTSSPEFELNEQRFYMRFNKDGNLILDGSRIRDIATDADGNPYEGSWHGSKALYLQTTSGARTVQAENIRFVIQFPGRETIELIPDSHGQFNLSGVEPWVKELFRFDPVNGAVYRGPGVAGMAEITGTASDGGHNLYWINAIKGDGTAKLDSIINVGAPPVAGDDGKTIQNWEILRRFNNDQCGPDSPWAPMFVPFYRRKQLEVRGGGQGTEGGEGAGETNAAAAASAAEANATRAARGEDQAVAAAAGGHAGAETDGRAHLDDDDGDVDEPETAIPRRALTTEQQAQRQENVRRANEAVRDFNRDPENQNPFIRIVVDENSKATNTDTIIDLIGKLREKLASGMTGLRNDPRYKNRNFIFSFKPHSNHNLEASDNETVIFNYNPDDEANEIEAIFRRHLENYDHDALVRKAKGQAAPARPGRPEGSPTASETDEAKIRRIGTEIINKTDHHVHFNIAGMPEADQVRVLGEFSKAWDQVSALHPAMKGRDNPHQTDTALKKGIILGFEAGNNTIKFDSQDRLLIPAGKTAAEIKAFLETAFRSRPSPGAPRRRT